MNPNQRPDLPLRTRPPRRTARTQIAGSAAVGVVAGAVLAALVDWDVAPIVGWDIAALTYLLWVWPTIWPLNAEATAEAAVPEDPTRASSDALTVGASLVSLLAVGLVLVRASTSSDATKVLFAGLCVASVAVSWAVVHTVYTLRYARLYYAGDDGGIDFKEDGPPRYSDFAYLAFTIGMTYQVSDTDLRTQSFRRVVIRHSILSYVFGTCIVATTVNLVANLAH